LIEGQVLCHLFIIGEIACGTLRNRQEIFARMAALPEAEVAGHDEVLELLNSRRLHGKGLAWVDLHLLASALLSRSPLWTLDKSLGRAAAHMKISA